MALDFCTDVIRLMPFWQAPLDDVEKIFDMP